MIKIYFAGSIRGGRELAGIYGELIEILGIYGRVLTEHVGDSDVIPAEESLPDREIFERDRGWIRESDAVVAEVSVPSLGVGYEIATAIGLNKPVLCLYNRKSAYPLSAMIAGNKELRIVEYESFAEAKSVLENFIREIKED